MLHSRKLLTFVIIKTTFLISLKYFFKIENSVEACIQILNQDSWFDRIIITVFLILPRFCFLMKISENCNTIERKLIWTIKLTKTAVFLIFLPFSSILNSHENGSKMNGGWLVRIVFLGIDTKSSLCHILYFKWQDPDQLLTLCQKWISVWD